MDNWPARAYRVLLYCLLAGPVFAQPSESNTDVSPDVSLETSRAVAVVGMPIETGWVLLDGKFIDPPYVIGMEGSEISINGQRVMMPASNRDGVIEGRWRGEGRGDGRADRGRGEQGRQRGSTFGVARIERQLIDGNLVVMVTDVGVATISRFKLPKFVDAMAADEPQAEKIRLLSGMAGRPVPSAVWLTTIEQYQPDPRLKQAAEKAQEESEQRARENEAKLSSVGWLDWAMPMMAIGGVLAGLGVLLNVYRHGLKEPGSYRVWRHVDTSGRRSRVVLILVSMLVLLNGLDLAFTIIAQQTGQFAELSPIGDRLITKPMLLGLYKVSAVGLGVGLLFYLRQRRVAEIAAWWMCALYVLVLVRWVAVNTLIMA